MFSARRTSTSFSRLASRRCAPFSSVCATMVMRAMASFSVGPTVSESILMASRRAREATRFRTPGLFSTYATSVCMLSSSSSGLGCGFHERAIGAANHFVQGTSGGHHGIDGIFLLDPEIDQDGFGGFARGANGGDYVGARGDALSANAEGVGQRGKIRSHERRGDVTLVVKEFL